MITRLVKLGAHPAVNVRLPEMAADHAVIAAAAKVLFNAPAPKAFQNGQEWEVRCPPTKFNASGVLFTGSVRITCPQLNRFD